MLWLLKTMAWLAWRRDTRTAALIAVGVSQFMDDRDVRDIADYYKAVLALREQQGQQQGEQRNQAVSE